MKKNRLLLFGIIFLVLLIVPDPLPVIDELIFGGLTIFETIKLVRS